MKHDQGENSEKSALDLESLSSMTGHEREIYEMVRHELKAPTTLREALAEEVVDALELLKLFYWLSKNEIVCTETPSLTLSRRDSAPVGQHGEQDEFTRAFVTSNEYSYFLNKRLSSGLS